VINNERGGREDADDGVIPKPITSKPYPCPVCKVGQVTGIVLFPLSLCDLNQAVELRKGGSRTDANSSSFSALQINGKRSADDSEFDDAHDVSYLLLSHSRPTASNSTSNEPDHHRTGRWTNDEIVLVDFLVDAFDRGNLPIPHGAKLNEFLGDMLLCKSSRLTKKMKNAKLSTRSYTLKGAGIGEADCKTLSDLVSKFLASVTDEPTKLELRFNMTKLWRMHFSNLCLQIGYTYLDAREWVAGLEEMERLASSAEESLRKARRRRIGLALQPERPEKTVKGDSVSAGDTPLTAFSSFGPISHQACSLLVDETTVGYSKTDDIGEATCEDDDFLASMMNIAKSPNLEGIAPSNRSRFFSVDFGLDESVDPLSIEPAMDTPHAPHHNLGDCGPFLEEIVSFMQAEQMPFQHVDVWVPSFVNQDGKSTNGNNNGGEQGQELRLFHAGYATRADLDEPLSFQLNEFGQYSTNFTFAPGIGLPGRVYSSGKYTWERNIQDVDSRIFLRSGGAKVYGIRTGFGLPLESALVGRMVIAMYSTLDMEEDVSLIEKCRINFAKYTPEPKWKLVIDMASTSTKAGTTNSFANPAGNRVPPIIPSSGSTSSLVHYSHDNSAAFTPVPARAQPEAASSIDHYTHGSAACVSSSDASNVKKKQHAANTTFPTRPERSTSTTSSVSQNAANDRSLSPRTPRPSSATCVPMEVSCTSTTSAVSARDIEDEEQRIATLLGDHMPLSEIPLPGESQSGSSNAAQLLPHFMSLRLLLLRSSTRRTLDENDMIDVIKKSFRCYSKDNRRTGAELATLLAKDWMYLHSTLSVLAEKKPSQDQYQTHKMTALTFGTMATSGGPTMMPSSFFPLTANQSSPPNLAPHRLVSMPSLSLDQFNGKQSDNNSSDERIRSRSVSASSENTYADVVPEN
jgi:hypothetical protein